MIDIEPPNYDLDAMAFDYEAAMLWLMGGQLEGAFIFGETPQGEAYWRQQAFRPTPEGRSTVTFMCKAHEFLTIQNASVIVA